MTMNRYIKIFLLLLAVSICFWLINNFLLKSVVSLKLSGVDTSQKITVRIEKPNGKQQVHKDINSSSPKFRLSPGNYVIYVSQSNSETIAYSELGWLKNQSLNITLSPQKAIDKVGSEGLGCDRFVGGTLYSYSCAKSSPILKHSYTPGKLGGPQPLLRGEEQLPVAVPYLSGLLAKFHAESDVAYLAYVDLTTSQVTRIKTLPGLNVVSALVISDEVNSSASSRFAVIDGNNIYIYQNLGSEPQKIELTKIGDQSLDNLARDYSIIGDKLMVYAGKAEQTGDDDTSADVQAKLKRSHLLAIDLTRPNDKAAAYTLPVEATNDDLYFIDSTHFAILKNDGLSIFSIDGQSVEHANNTFGVTVAKPTSGGLYFVLNNGVYFYSPKTNQSILVFRSGHINISSLFSNGGQLSFNAFINNGQTDTLHSYLIKDASVTLPRLEDKLPYDQNSSLPVFKTEYSGTSVTFQLALNSITSDRQTGRVSYDQAEFDGAKQKVIDRLKADGFDVDKLELHFTN